MRTSPSRSMASWPRPIPRSWASRCGCSCSAAREPDAVTAQMLDIVRQQIAFQGIELEVVAAEGMTCGNCGCGSGE